MSALHSVRKAINQCFDKIGTIPDDHTHAAFTELAFKLDGLAEELRAAPPALSPEVEEAYKEDLIRVILAGEAIQANQGPFTTEDLRAGFIQSLARYARRGIFGM